MTIPLPIETERLTIRAFRPELDSKEMTAVYGDPEVMRHIPGGAVSGTDAVRVLLNAYAQAQADHGFSSWAVVERETGHLIGDVGFGVFEPTGDIELGYTLARSAWGRGYATEAARACLAAGLEHLAVPRIIAAVDADNEASLRVAERIGMARWKSVEAHGRPHVLFVADAITQGDSLPTLLGRIVDAVVRRKPPGEMRTRIVAVDGAGGAGKSTFARHLAEALGGCAIVHTDDFASWDNPIDWWPELIERLLLPISRGQPACFTPTQWTPSVTPEAVDIAPAEFLVLEGVSASRQAFRPYLTYTIWIETSAEVRLRRGLERDGDDGRAQWETWMAEEDAYRARERPDLAADLVVDGERNLWS